MFGDVAVSSDIVALLGVVLSIVLMAGVALMAWTLTQVVKLSNLVAALEERVRNLVTDIDHLQAGNPEIRRRG